jgi:hypothetical protein
LIAIPKGPIEDRMSQAPTPLETKHGYAPPIVTQFSVFLPNKVGKLLDLVEEFDGSPVQICAISVNEASDCAIVRIITNSAKTARDILKNHHLAFTETDLLVVELAQGHSLSNLCLSLLGAELSIQFAYPLMLRPNGTPTIALAVDDLTLAGQILRKKSFRLFGEGDLPAHGQDGH